MINVKLIVVFIFVDIVSGNPYCKICPHHTLCKYTMPGPDESCRSYDKAALLTRNDIKEILTKLNERRNYVAMGYSKLLPTAANMRKIFWSEELALFAQRWVDRCDQSLWPDKEDQCRDLKNGGVGQSIATVAGATSTFNVKSLVDIWFMKTLDYSGSVAYYNQSRDSNTKYFTQMIWAKTSLVGCGKARFYIDHKNTIVERLVCNFAPQGNIHGKPVYAIGFPATQCPEGTRPDEDFKGLCRRFREQPVNYSNYTNERKTTTSSWKVSSLLRILNLSNNSAKQAIDPIRNNFKQFKTNTNISVEERNQKIRHIENNSYGSIGAGSRYVNPMPIITVRPNRKPIMSVTPDQEPGFYVQERGHSRVHHDHHMHINEHTPSMRTTEEAFRRFDYMTDTYEEETPPEFRNYNLNNQCTRANTAPLYNTETHNLRKSNVQNQCTRGTKYWAHTTCNDQTKCQHDVYSRELCPCNVPVSTCTEMTTCSTPAPMPTKCMCNMNCQCPKLDYPRNECHDTFVNDKRKFASALDYYEQITNFSIRSGRRNFQNKNLNGKMVVLNKKWQKMKNTTSFQTRHASRPSTIYARKYSFNENDHKVINEDHMEVIHKNFDFYKRNRRDLTKEAIYKPFWEMDELTTKKSVELKSLRYTTLSNKRKRIKYKKQSTITERITFGLSEKNQVNRKIIVTEKYLSFDELMRLRKLGETDIVDVYEARRQAKTPKATTTTKAAATTTTKATTTSKATGASSKATKATKATTTTKTTKEITTNTPFERKKYCTRKLTCTWTAITVTGSDGLVIGGPQIDAGSLTPPGYVEGCTRTFTCTRIYMDRNKFSAASDQTAGFVTGEEATSHGQGGLPHGDEDYCEKRALDVRRRESGDKYYYEHSTPNTFSQLSSPIFNDNDKATTEKMQHETSDHNDCSYNKESLRVKRDEIHYNDQHNRRETLSYGDLYYRVLQKIISGWRNHHPTDKHKCACSYGIRNTVNTFIIIFLLFVNLTYILFIQ